jgi:chromosome segregation ATPase
MLHARHIIALAAAAALAGCTTADCDPSRADLFSGIGCSASGRYAAREAGLRNDLAGAQANELEQQAHANAAAADAARAQSDLQAKRQAVAKLDRQLDSLKRQVAAARQRQGVDQASLGRAEADLAALQARREQVSPQSNDADLRALERSTQELNDKLNHDGVN